MVLGPQSLLLLLLLGAACARERPIAPRSPTTDVDGGGWLDDGPPAPPPPRDASRDATGPSDDAAADAASEGGMDSAVDLTAAPPDGNASSLLCTAGDCRAFTGQLDGFLHDQPCGDAGSGFDCAGTMCTGGTSTRTRTFAIKGDPARVYELSFRVRGVVEAKNYSGGLRRATGLDPSSQGGDQWYEGGTAPSSTYNSYELRVSPVVPGAPGIYFLNARDGTPEGHSSWALDYTATIPVPGGATVTFRAFDSNCRHIMNCGPGNGSPSTGCRAPRTLLLQDAVPGPPATFVQPPRNAQGAPGQWIFIDVTAVKAR